METSDQVHPLAPASASVRSHDAVVDEEKTSPATATKDLRRKRCLRCCGICVAILIILAVVIVTLVFTVFKAKDPTIRFNNVSIDGLGLLAGVNRPRVGSNMSLNADVSVKNPNYASFKFPNTLTTIFYHGEVIGDARGPPGRAKARRTLRMNMTVEVMTDRVMARPELMSDVRSGTIEISTFTAIAGRMKILFVRRHMRIRMNCTMSLSLATQAVEQQRCRRNVDF